jgi:hypothetical protein
VLFLVTAEFGLVSFIIPAIPDVEPLPTATIDLFATPTTTLVEDSGTLDAAPQETLSPESDILQAGCIPEEVMITYPENESTVRDIVEVEGTVNIADFGFYKFEISRGDSNNWLTIQAGDSPKEDEMLGFWDTTQLETGNYYLRLVVVDNQGLQREPCTVYLYVDAPSE